MPRPTPLTATPAASGTRPGRREPGEPVPPALEVGSVAIVCISSRSVPALKPRPLPVMQHDGHVRVLGRLEQRVGGGVVQRLVEGVERLGPVEGQRAHPVGVVRSGVSWPEASVARAGGGEQERVWRPDWPCRSRRAPPAPPRRRRPDVPHRRRTATVWRGIRTPEGPATLHVRGAAARGRGARRRPGARAPTWVLDSLPALLGADDDWSGFEPRHPVLAEARRRHPHCAARPDRLVMEALVPGDHRAEGHRQGGVRRLPGAGAPLRRAGARARAASAGSGCSPTPEHAAHDPVVGVAAAAHRPGPLAHGRDRRPGRRRRWSAPRRCRHDEADRRLRSLPGDRGVDQRRGPAAGARRPRRGVASATTTSPRTSAGH